MDKCDEHTAHEQHLKRLDTRVGELEEDGKELSRFTARLTVLIDKYDEALDDHDTRLAALEAVPAKRWETAVNYALTAVLGLVVGGIMAHMGL